MSKEDKSGGRTKPVFVPKPLHEQLADASAAQIEREGGGYLAPRERADVLPERTQVTAPSINDRLAGIPDNGTRGAGDLDATTKLPEGWLRDPVTLRVRPKNHRDFEREARERASKGQK